MSREELEEASGHLRRAAETAEGETREKLAEQSQRFADAASRESGPDHGWLDRHTHVVRELGEELDEEGREHVDDAVERINAYRETVPGV
ncbi:DUF7553 family protein [Halorarum salinum]|uniref:Uncharacterized protein n=1 Tax=Halorarum salinum TaxID=2743089 RepID=A0A7D5L8V3_9EURY|nr:hypothetical protein [Halobaculum salinum]QLG60933.1 hypothetical protein HUG12_03925 [Halobaculum salinum]